MIQKKAASVVEAAFFFAFIRALADGNRHVIANENLYITRVDRVADFRNIIVMIFYSKIKGEITPKILAIAY
jgi:hypothetical protein